MDRATHLSVEILQLQNIPIVWHYLRDPTFSLFTARGYAKRGICRRRVSVCVCVYVSVTLRYCIKTAKRRIMQITPHDSPMTLVLMPKIMAKFERDHPGRSYFM